MPEIAIEENSNARFPKNDVGMPGQSLCVRRKPEPASPKPCPDKALQPCILTTDARHAVASLRPREIVRHQISLSAEKTLGAISATPVRACPWNAVHEINQEFLSSGQRAREQYRLVRRRSGVSER